MQNLDFYETYDDDIFYENSLTIGPIFRDMTNPMEWYRDDEFKNRYRMTKSSMMNLLMLIMEKLQRPTYRHRSLPAVIQLCIAIRFYCTGCYQAVLGDFVKKYLTTSQQP